MALEPWHWAATSLQGAPKKKIKVTQVVNGIDTEVEIEVDDVAALAWPERSKLRVLNQPILRVDGPVKVSGAARYAHDVRAPGMVWARLLVSPLPRAKVANLDVEAARKVRGVVHVLVVKDGETGWLGDPVAAVAAESLEAAEDGLRALAARFDELPWVVDQESAMRADAPKISRDGNVSKPELDGEEDDARAALQSSATRVKGTYREPVQHHGCLETHGVVVDYRGGDSATVYCSTQYAQGFAADAAKILGLPANAVTGIVQHMGGGFGSKFGLDLPGMIACKIAKAIGRPVHLMLGRREEFLMAGNRSGGEQTIEIGCDAAGSITGLVADSYKHGGIGRGSLAGFPYCYTAAEHFRSVRSVRMHLDANRAMRAPGHPQASFAMESVLDELAYAGKHDLLAIRKRNANHEAWQRQLDRVAREIGWDAHPHKTQPGPAEGTECIGIGFAISAWGGGGSADCEVEVRLDRDGSVTTSCGIQDLGTGTRTYMAAITAEVLGLRTRDVKAELGDSRLGQGVGSGGSVTTASLAPAVMAAATKARTALAKHLAGVLGLDAEGFRFLPAGVVHERAKTPTVMTWKKACGTLPAEGLRAQGEWVAALASRGTHCAQAARVGVDPGTGRVRVLHMACVQEVGLPLNRLALKSQIQGAMITALGYALSEGRILDTVLGLQLNASFEGYKMPHALEIPRLTAIIDDDDLRPAVIGVGEPPVIPGAGAIANAVHNACGARVRELPITPDKVLAALGKVV